MRELAVTDAMPQKNCPTTEMMTRSLAPEPGHRQQEDLGRPGQDAVLADDVVVGGGPWGWPGRMATFRSRAAMAET